MTFILKKLSWHMLCWIFSFVLVGFFAHKYDTILIGFLNVITYLGFFISLTGLLMTLYIFNTTKQLRLHYQSRDKFIRIISKLNESAKTINKALASNKYDLISTESHSISGYMSNVDYLLLTNEENRKLRALLSFKFDNDPHSSMTQYYNQLRHLISMLEEKQESIHEY